MRGLGELAYPDLLGYRDAAQFGDERDPHAIGKERELGGEVGGFGDGLGGESGQTARPLDHFVAGPPVVRHDPTLACVVNSGDLRALDSWVETWATFE
jgi:hypothetical protein